MRITETLVIDERALEERFVRASGPGGQNVNKVSTAVELRLHLATSSLPETVQTRLRALAGRRLTTDDVIVVDSREYRTQAQNREAARERLAALVRAAAAPRKRRRATKPTAGSKARRLDDKKRRSDLKARRSGRD